MEQQLLTDFTPSGYVYTSLDEPATSQVVHKMLVTFLTVSSCNSSKHRDTYRDKIHQGGTVTPVGILTLKNQQLLGLES